jgi:CubicO group peptidase (beta-lactamase class C family)
VIRTLLVAATLLAAGVSAQAQVPAGFDAAIETVLQRNDIAGASVAVARNGKLLFARGYGLADREARTPVSTATRFRIASLSKPITAAAVLDLVGRGRLSLDAPIAPLLGDQASAVPGARAVTVRHLLQRTSQWGVGSAELGGPDLDRLMARIGATD